MYLIVHLYLIVLGATGFLQTEKPSLSIKLLEFWTKQFARKHKASFRAGNCISDSQFFCFNHSLLLYQIFNNVWTQALIVWNGIIVKHN